MSFQNPWGLLALLAVPALIALYILKQKHKEIKVPGLLLWKKTQAMMEASTPWQKLRRNLLFFLQLLAVIALALAIANPAINAAGAFDDICVIIDASASMQATDNGKTRYEMAIDECKSLAAGLRKGQTMSVIFAGNTVYPAVSHSDSRYEIKDALASYNGSLYSEADLETAILLAESMISDSKSSEIIVLTDFYVESDKTNIKYVNLAKDRTNVAVLRFTSGHSSNALMAMCTVESFGKDKDVTLELYADDVLCDAKNVSLKDNVATSIYWTSIPETAQLLTVKVKEDDCLTCDNVLSTTVKSGDTQKVMVVSDSGYFWEKVLSAVSSYDLYKVTPANYSGNDQSYDLIIFDNYVPTEMPANCSFWLINPKSDTTGITVGSQIKGTSLTEGTGTIAETICDYVNPASILVSAFNELTLDASYKPVLLCGTYPAVAARQGDDGAKTVVFAFDIHNTNLALLKEFPILVRNLLSWSLPEMLEGDGTVLTGNVVNVKSLTYSTEIKVKNPDGHDETFKDGYFIASVPGLYSVTQKIERGQNESASTTYVTDYIVSVIPSGESAMSATGVTTEETKAAAYKGQYMLRPYLLIALMLLLIAEWWVYNREY